MRRNSIENRKKTYITKYSNERIIRLSTVYLSYNVEAYNINESCYVSYVKRVRYDTNSSSGSGSGSGSNSAAPQPECEEDEAHIPEPSKR